MENRQRLNAGDWLHLLQILVLLVSVGVFYERVETAMKAVDHQGAELDRIEHYLSAKDADYWQLRKQDE